MRIISIAFALLLTISCNKTVTDQEVLMKEAKPVWAEDREKEMNLNLGFHGVFEAEEGKEVKLRITGSTLYRLYLNGEYIGYGPARAAHGYYRVDEYDLSNKVLQGSNVVAVEVAGYNINTFYTIDVESFLLAEVESSSDILLATGSENDFKTFKIDERVQKVERYSYQRPFTEYYILEEGYNDWRYDVTFEKQELDLATFPEVELLPRNLIMPEYKVVYPKQFFSRGVIEYKKPARYRKDRSLTRISDILKGYKEEDLTVMTSQFTQEIVNKTVDIQKIEYTPQFDLKKDEFVVLDFGINLSGFIGANISCDVPSKVMFYFDEILTNDDVNTKRRMPDINNQVVYELDPGSYDLETFETYTYKYLKFIVLEGECNVDNIYLREYAYPRNDVASFNSSNNKLNAIYEAAWETYRQNSVDIFMDCPSRERAGWLCDSYFMAKMEKEFTGKLDVAYNFYENYALPDSFAYLPEGMVPMCYPADHYNGNFISNWAMWLIVQMEDYDKMGGDKELVAKMKVRFENLLEYFEQFENEDGLLEKLDKWTFVEWSKANDFVQDVNYPTNMLYSYALRKAGELYDNDFWIEKAEHVKDVVLEQSFNGDFFVDNAVRDEDGVLKVTENTTEVCQYYAFFFDIATPDSHSQLWSKLTTEFGPNRNDSEIYPDVYRANAFIGNYLRMDILSRYGLQKQMLNEIQDYFYGMAELTGTLWENMSSHASCNHGFASYLGHVLYRDVLGVYNIDYQDKEVTFRFADLSLNECEGTIPVGDEAIRLEWKRNGDDITYSYEVPEGYSVKIENLIKEQL